jgi:hypothetical protein
MPLVGPVWIAAVVMAVAGAWKVARPVPTVAALARLGVALPVAAVRVLGVGELAVAVAAVVVGGRFVLGAVALSYVGFAIVADRLRRLPDRPGCGCFGNASTPPGATHVAVNAAAALLAGGAAALGAPGAPTVLAASPGAGVPFVGSVVVGAAATLVLLTVLPDVRAAAARLDAPPSAGAAAVTLFGPRIPLRAGLATPTTARSAGAAGAANAAGIAAEVTP